MKTYITIDSYKVYPNIRKERSRAGSARLVYYVWAAKDL